MAKEIKYQYLSSEINHGTEENPDIEQIIENATIICPTQADFDANYPIAESEAIPGKIKVVGEFDPEPEPVETADDVLNALLGVK